MTSHELARKLLNMPDLPVVVQDGMDPSDPKILEHVRLSQEGDISFIDGLNDDQLYISLE